jgi:hypothetical protein
MKVWTIAFLAACLITGCADEPGNAPPPSTTEPAAVAAQLRSPGGAATIDYQVIGSPVVGKPVAIDLQIRAADASQPLILGFRINDTTAMRFPEAQPPSVTLAPAGDGQVSTQQVRVIPMREGRLFLNVAASVANGEGSLSTAMAIPLTVAAAPDAGITENAGQRSP